VATGGGCAIALTCDLRVCSPDARFGVPIAKTLGNCLSIANSARLIDLLGPARFKDLMITARLMDVKEASSLGLITRVAETHRIDEVTRELAITVAGHAPITIAVAKEMVRRIQEHRRPAAEAAHDLIGRCYASGDFKEGVEAFLAKRAPHWSGR
jgi:enoyl-CoA hydratase/carnithine racemase